jgi:hypothetical protein
MKRIFLLMFMFVACSNYNPSNPNNINYINADSYNWDKHNGKVIKSIMYFEYPDNGVTGCNEINIQFTDGTRVRCHVYKYTPKISE